ncbi:1-acyl-sn-glycerol-3-phosphate acyltransferase [Mycoplasma testudineum]|uniref:1-acyl-sn-glycerol-3-phosphate acyltransferase n=1 Tax=Mycoplasma testudineum TaxID=244584 RepID=A0A4R6IH43_9MOLU|nr:lysophospholipid acyltransferase family protein [Mycoplasma testudineum]OYD26800.1 1-acyl-sn-glycerol-3-phosphate acyltransferase [Mycoplasma testudineum]TDO20335.1 1-acyl-sn-glycerol-3-phosphate acyltransferase [Mycoplasma testudineum]
MSPSFKLFLNSPYLMFKLLRLEMLARKHRRYPQDLDVQKRNDFILKIAKRMLKIYNIKVVVKGRENLEKAPALIMPNHNDNLDVFALMYAMLKTTQDKSVNHELISFLGKIELTRKRIVKHAVELLDGVFIDRAKFKSAWNGTLDFGVMVKENKKYGVIFPEGTRSETGVMGEFKRGAFKLAKINLLPIIPTTINYSKVGFDKKNKKATVEVIFNKPIAYKNILALSEEALMKNTKSAIEKEYLGGDKHE